MFRSIAIIILLCFAVSEARTIYADSVLTDTGTVGTGFALFSGKAHWRPSKGVAWREIKVVPDSAIRSATTAVADSTIKNGVHGVTQYRLPYSNGTNRWGTTNLYYNPSYENFGFGSAAVSNSRIYAYFAPVNAGPYAVLYASLAPTVTVNSRLGGYGFNFTLNSYIQAARTDSGVFAGALINSYHNSAGQVGNLEGTRINVGSIGVSSGGSIYPVFGTYVRPSFRSGSFPMFSAFACTSEVYTGGTVAEKYFLYSYPDWPSLLNGSLIIDSDTASLRLGEDQDAAILHDGTNTVIRTSTGKATISDGTLELVDSAQVWNDVADMTLSGIKGVGSAGEPTWAATGVGISLNRFAIGDSAQAHGEISHGFTMGDSGDVHVHYHVNGEDTTPRHIGVTLRTQIYNAMSDSVTWYNSTDVYDTIPANTNHFSHRVIHTGKLSMPNIAKGAIVYQSVIRIAHGTAPTSNPFFSKGGMHRKVNSLGSTTIY